MKFAPFDTLAAHILKIGSDGAVHEIKAMVSWRLAIR
jgi:hypothetical protein